MREGGEGEGQGPLVVVFVVVVALVEFLTLVSQAPAEWGRDQANWHQIEKLKKLKIFQVKQDKTSQSGLVLVLVVGHERVGERRQGKRR